MHTAHRTHGFTGQPEGNEVSINSKHLRGGHYVVSSDFRIKLRQIGVAPPVQLTSY